MRRAVLVVYLAAAAGFAVALVAAIGMTFTSSVPGGLAIAAVSLIMLVYVGWRMRFQAHRLHQPPRI
jgi:type III secretory pathway component EscS